MQPNHPLFAAICPIVITSARVAESVADECREAGGKKVVHAPVSAVRMSR
jgi:hypothetical protein